MDPTAILESAQAWSPEQKWDVALRLWDEVSESGWQPEADDELAAELDRRLDAHAADPGNVRTTLLLAGARISQGDTREALRLIAPLESHADGATRRGALLLHAEILPVGLARAAYLATRLDEPWTHDELVRISDLVRNAGDPALRRAV